MTDHIDKHCIKLDGSIPYASPLKKFVHSREALVCAVLIGWSAIKGSSLQEDPYMALSVYASLVAGAASGRAIHNWRLGKKLKKYFGAAHDGLFINKKPDENSLPTKPSHILASHTVRNDQMSSAIARVIGLGLGGALINMFNNSADAPSQTASSDPSTLSVAIVGALLTAAVTYYTKYYSTALRFNKIVKQKWVITDEPPRKTEDVTLKDIADRYLPKPAAQPTHARIPSL